MPPAAMEPDYIENETNGTEFKRLKTLDHSNTAAIVQKLSTYGNPALHVTPDHQIHLEPVEVPTPTAHEALVHVRCTGVCGSDMHLWHRGAIGPLVVDRPCVLGHEPAGVVLAVGSAVRNLTPGDRVALEPGVPCRNCWLCEKGKYNLCEDVKFLGVGGIHGTIRRFVTHDAKLCHKIPDGMSFAQGALAEPLSVILHAVNQCAGSLGIGKPALICGAGPIGLCALAAARASGSWPILITDFDQSKLDFAKAFCPGILTYKVEFHKSAIQASEEIRAAFGCLPRDVEKGVPSPNEYVAPSTVLECTGVESSVVTAAYTCRRSGLVMVVGVGRSIMNNLPFMHLSLAEIDLRFINRYSDTWPAAINALNNGNVINLDAMVTHTFPLEQAVQAMEACADPNEPTVKAQIVDDTPISL
ncbi:L-arabinitol 4-dehydrogenase-like [Teratosphaeria destructans]|uniref:L-arabinitol 4-dehydrogenase-like n=1 Tax=Teratosphaeria destructans TaxID=418781 RepID=A0A9W7T0R8_9PEZI|nr:L-arabinitol 4-dehydrogenase-like [Teratosphaeria destructans]